MGETPNPSEKEMDAIEKLTRELVEQLGFSESGGAMQARVICHGFIDAAYARGVEDAAKVAEHRAAVWKAKDGDCSFSLEEECEDIACAIRRLIEGK